MNRAVKILQKVREAKFTNKKLSETDYLNILLGRVNASFSIKDLKSVNLNKILDEMIVPERSDNWKRVLINVQKFDALWKKTDPELYVGVNGRGGIKSRYSDFVAFLLLDPNVRKNKWGKLETPEVEITEVGEIRFVNGRHRYSVFRDAGVKYLPVAMRYPDRARQLGLLKK